MRIALIGYGRMGQMVESCLLAENLGTVAGIVDQGHLPSLSAVQGADVAIDFSYPGDLDDVLTAALAMRLPLVIGRTGLTDAQGDAIRTAARRIPIVWASNFSIGVTVLTRLAREAAKVLADTSDMEIVETHHRGKLDAPSGTAKMLLSAVDPAGERDVLHGREGTADARGREIGVHALRGGSVAGDHSVTFLMEGEQVTLSHRAESRRVFATGALRAARFATGQAPGCYDMEDVLFGHKE